MRRGKASGVLQNPPWGISVEVKQCGTQNDDLDLKK